jgi:hypothetical protein
MKRFLIFLIVGLFYFSVIVNAEEIQVHGIDILEYGIYTTKKTKTIESPSLSGEKGRILKEVTFATETDRIDALVGTHFGFLFAINGEPKGRKVDIKQVTIFPASGLRDSMKGEVFYKNEYITSLEIGMKWLKGYGFDEEWELVPGKWIFQLWHKDRKLAEKTFTVYRPF